MKPAPGSLDTLRLYRVGSLVDDPFLRIDTPAPERRHDWTAYAVAAITAAAAGALYWWRWM